ncbi:MAG: PilZ domain-containing protein [Spirochaetales bacterium]|nr:PilZ domain-containing protein [Spirochaetales bacterium]
MWFIIPIIIVFVLFVAAFLLLRRLGHGNFPWIQFYGRGKESGFTFKEINLLRKIAIESEMQNPTSLFWSVKQLDRSIKGIIIKNQTTGGEADERNIHMVAKLYQFRKRVEFSQPKYKIGIKSSRNLVQHQKLRVMLPGLGPFYTSVVENLRKYIALSYPRGPKLPPGFSWKNQKIGVYFFRQTDAGYFFQTRVLNDFIDKRYPIIHVAHADNLVRTQKRRSVRVDCSIPAMLYPLRNLAEASDDLETSNGLRSMLVDLSEDGAAIMIGGQAKVGIAVKLQFGIGDNTIVMSGVIKGTTYDQKKNRSILHMQAQPMNVTMQNRVLTYVYNIFGERQERTPVAPAQNNPRSL